MASQAHVFLHGMREQLTSYSTMRMDAEMLGEAYLLFDDAGGCGDVGEGLSAIR